MAEELLTLGAVRDAINTEYRKRHGALQEEYKRLGLERQRITTPDEIEFGTVVLAAGSTTVLINDHDAMVEWLEQHHPEHLVEKTTHTIHPTYLKLLTEAAKKAGVGVDPSTGQRLDWLSVTTADPTLRATPTREAKTMVRNMITKAGLQLELENE